MSARTGQDYIAGLQEHPREVWIGGEKVTDVTSHPGLRNNVFSIADLYDLQSDSALGDEMTYVSPKTGDQVGLSFIIPNSIQDLQRRGRMMYGWARSHGGMMGRTPDYLNVCLAAMAASAEYFAENQPLFGENVFNYYEFIRENDLCLTHTLLNPQRSRSQNNSGFTQNRSGAAVEDAALKVVDETDAGIVVKGARMMATLGPISDEIAVFPSRAHPTVAQENAEKYAMSFSIPCHSPGLKFVCRESFDYGRSHFDHPLGSRFDEMDAMVFFDNVLVPWERVFLLKDVQRCNDMASRTGWIVHAFHQTVTRMVAKSEFILGASSLMVETLGSANQPHVQERLAELVMYLEIMKSLLRTSEAEAVPNEWGLISPSRTSLSVAHLMYSSSLYPRMVEITQLLGSSSLISMASSADFENDALRAQLDQYVATDTASALERTKLFHLAWDISCSAFGSRQLHYERFFAGDSVRNSQILLSFYDRDPAMKFVSNFLARDDSH